MMRKGHRRMLIGLKLVLAAFVLWFLADTGALDFSLLNQGLARPWALVVATGLIMLTYWAAALRWRQLLSTQRISMRVSHATRLTFLGLFLNAFLPGGGVGGDAVRVAYAVKAAPRQEAGAVLSVFADRILGLYGMMIVATAMIPLHWDAVHDRWELMILALAAMASVVGLPLTFTVLYLGLRRSTRLRAFMTSTPQGLFPTILHRLIEAAVLFRRRPRAIAKAMGLTLFIGFAAVASVAIVASALSADSGSATDFAFAAPWAWLANVLPLTPGGLGVGEAAFDQVCQWLAPESAAAYGTIFLLYRLVTIVASLPGLLGYAVYHDYLKFMPHDAKATDG